MNFILVLICLNSIYFYFFVELIETKEMNFFDDSLNDLQEVQRTFFLKGNKLFVVCEAMLLFSYKMVVVGILIITIATFVLYTCNVLDIILCKWNSIVAIIQAFSFVVTQVNFLIRLLRMLLKKWFHASNFV